jgi:hypothetical protein
MGDYLGIMTLGLKFDIPDTLNRILPEIKPMDIDAFLTSVWKN